ncbi:MAG: hypothetical protein Q8O34_00840 [Rhodocyclaceae bacterium]|nr:hypothetical protein [Rhodocyclaceae bacterium]
MKRMVLRGEVQIDGVRYSGAGLAWLEGCAVEIEDGVAVDGRHRIALARVERG